MSKIKLPLSASRSPLTRSPSIADKLRKRRVVSVHDQRSFYKNKLKRIYTANQKCASLFPS